MSASFGPARTIGDHRCPCGRPLDEDGDCYRCDRAGFDPDTSETEPAATVPTDLGPPLLFEPRVSHYTDLPADDPRRFSFDMSPEDNPHPFGIGNADAGANDRISRRPRGGGR